MPQVTIRRPSVKSICATSSVPRQKTDHDNRRLDFIDGEFSSILASLLGFLHHLITLFARARNSGESVSPICFAAFKLITNSNFVACCTGKSAGLAPFKILSTYHSRAPIEIIEVHPIGHEAALIDKLLRKVNSRQPVFAGKLDDPLSFREKGASGTRHYR